MRQEQFAIDCNTTGPGLYEVTDAIDGWLRTTGITAGLLTILCRHTSASLLITENASGAVHRDMQRWLERMAPQSGDYEHDDEGPDDMPAHLKAALTGVNLSIPVTQGRMALGTWQGLFLAEHRHAPHRRNIALHVMGD